MDKLDIAVRWNGESKRVVAVTGWIVWSMRVGRVGSLSDDQAEYETQLYGKNTMVLRGVTLNKFGAVESIDSVEFDTFVSIADYPEEFITWIESITNVKTVFKPEQIEDKYNPVTNPVGYQLANGKELKELLPDLMGKEQTAGFYKGNAIKYLTRYREKNGREDLEKAKQYIDMLIALEY